MWKRLAIPLFAATATLTVGAGTALAVQQSTASTSAAMAAASTWTVTPGGPITGTAASLVASDTTTGASLTCQDEQTNGTSKSGVDLDGVGIMYVLSQIPLQCEAPTGLAFSLTAQNFPWSMNAVSYNPATGVSNMTINGVQATTTGPNCSAQVGGASPGTGGTVDATFSNSTHQLTLLSTGNLHLWNVSGCGGALKSGDSSALTGTWSFATQQTMTSP
jgi:hypothetical protein